MTKMRVIAANNMLVSQAMSSLSKHINPPQKVGVRKTHNSPKGSKKINLSQALITSTLNKNKMRNNIVVTKVKNAIGFP